MWMLIEMMANFRLLKNENTVHQNPKKSKYPYASDEEEDNSNLPSSISDDKDEDDP